MKSKYVLIFSVATILVAGTVLAEQPTTWTQGNFRYERVNGGIKVTQINRPAQAQARPQNLPPRTPPQQPIQQPAEPAPEQPTQPTPPAEETPASSLDVASVAPISDINVAYETDLSSANLPTTITATLSDSTTQDLAVTWDSGTPAYDGNTAGAYVFSGSLTLLDNITNTNDIKASVNVIVPEQPQAQPEEPDPILDVLEEAAAGLLNSIGEFINFILSPFKMIGNIIKK